MPRHTILKTILQRLVFGAMTLFFISLIIFSAIAVLPSDFAKALLGQSATPAAVAALEKEVGLDRPAPERYVTWIAGALHGDFGYSFAGRGAKPRAVSALIAPRLLNTLFLALMTTVISVPIALALGILLALYRNSWFDRVVNAAALTAISAPEFLLAYVLMLLLAIKLPVFYTLATVTPESSFGERVLRCALPALTPTLVILAHMMRMTRTAIVDLVSTAYVEMAELKGMSRARVILYHALPNAWAPIVNVVAINVAYLIVGVVVIEFVFVYPGIGKLMVDAVKTRDIPVVQACALIFAATYILLNLFADIVSIVTNPRLLHPR